MLASGGTYEELRERFRWQIPEFYNIGVDVCDRWAAMEPERPVIFHVDPQGQCETFSFGDLKDQSNRLANLLSDYGLKRGDRVAILLPQVPETAIAHIAIHKAGAISLPLFTLFGIEALAYRLADSGASVVITNREGAAKLAEIRGQLPGLRQVFSIDGGDGAGDLHSEMAKQSARFRTGPHPRR